MLRKELYSLSTLQGFTGRLTIWFYSDLLISNHPRDLILGIDPSIQRKVERTPGTRALVVLIKRRHRYVNRIDPAPYTVEEMQRTAEKLPPVGAFFERDLCCRMLGLTGGTFLQWERALGEHGAIDQVLATIERDNNGPVIGTTDSWRGQHRTGCPSHMKAQRP